MRSLLIGVLLAFASESNAAGKVYENQHELFVDALKNGRASGDLNGDMALRFNTQFRTEGPLLADVKTIGITKRADCKKLEATLVKPGIKTPQGVTDGTMILNFIYCLDGSPPVGAQ